MFVQPGLAQGLQGPYYRPIDVDVLRNMPWGASDRALGLCPVTYFVPPGYSHGNSTQTEGGGGGRIPASQRQSASGQHCAVLESPTEAACHLLPSDAFSG